MGTCKFCSSPFPLDQLKKHYLQHIEKRRASTLPSILQSPPPAWSDPRTLQKQHIEQRLDSQLAPSISLKTTSTPAPSPPSPPSPPQIPPQTFVLTPGPSGRTPSVETSSKMTSIKVEAPTPPPSPNRLQSPLVTQTTVPPPMATPSLVIPLMVTPTITNPLMAPSSMVTPPVATPPTAFVPPLFLSSHCEDKFDAYEENSSDPSPAGERMTSTNEKVGRQKPKSIHFFLRLLRNETLL